MAGAGAKAATATERDTFGLLVYRRIGDDNPLRVITRPELDVAGQAREITLDSVLLPGSIPLGLDSPCPPAWRPTVSCVCKYGPAIGR